jgi:Uma2 family endonuclease
MNVPALKRMTVPEFLAWAETQDSGRYELVRGEIVAMAPRPKFSFVNHAIG